VLIVTVDRAGNVPLIRITRRANVVSRAASETRTTDRAVALDHVDEWLRNTIAEIELGC
jgi:hypothetical protein